MKSEILTEKKKKKLGLLVLISLFLCLRNCIRYEKKKFINYIIYTVSIKRVKREGAPP